MRLFHTSPAAIIWINGNFEFKRTYPPEYLGLHAWHKRSIAEDRMRYSCNSFLYEFDYPIDSIDGLREVDHGEIAIIENKPHPFFEEIAVKLQEDSGAGKNNYHAVVLDYSHITNWRELQTKK
ncbi:hypothetical protein [Aliagarivorans marinus]|uniref:hypothetical protein n=1 Tax=Aliagarivorans marinus TaxID=561965 RepID=UPI00047C38C0|nr:hypothetical protein [Aliagarivorans marinus]